MSTGQAIAIVVVILLIAVGAGVGIYFYIKNKDEAPAKDTGGSVNSTTRPPPTTGGSVDDYINDTYRPPTPRDTDDSDPDSFPTDEPDERPPAEREVSRHEVVALYRAYMGEPHTDTCPATRLSEAAETNCHGSDQWERIGYLLRGRGAGRRAINVTYGNNDTCIVHKDFNHCHSTGAGRILLGYAWENPTNDTVELRRAYGNGDTCSYTVPDVSDYKCHGAVGDSNEVFGYIYPADYFDEDKVPLGKRVADLPE
jgi:hypothetical protein